MTGVQPDMFLSFGGVEVAQPAHYPQVAGAKDSDTGKAAAMAITRSGKADALRLQIVEYLRNHPAGIAPDEFAHLIREHILNVRPRFSELAARNIIKATGAKHLSENGKPQNVMALVEGN